jgi:hypothetical protein
MPPCWPRNPSDRPEARHGEPDVGVAVAVVVLVLAVAAAVVDVVGAAVLVAVVAVVVGAGLPAAVAGVDDVPEPPALPQAASSIAAATTMTRRLRSFPFTPVRGVVPVSRAHHGP